MASPDFADWPDIGGDQAELDGFLGKRGCRGGPRSGGGKEHGGVRSASWRHGVTLSVGESG